MPCTWDGSNAFALQVNLAPCAVRHVYKHSSSGSPNTHACAHAVHLGLQVDTMTCYVPQDMCISPATVPPPCP